MRDAVWIAGIPIDRIDYAGLLDQIGAWIESDAAGGHVRQICTVNPEFIVDAQQDAAFWQVLLDADLCVADGVGVAWAAARQAKPVPERVTGSDGIYRICERAAQQGWRLFFLGAAPGVAEDAAATLTALYPGLQVAGCFSGSPYAAEWPEIESRLKAARADLVFVAFGHPKQDFWIHTHRADLPAKVAVGVGGAFDFVTGIATRVPQWMRSLGIEWLHRLITQPWRWRRMLKLPRLCVAGTARDGQS